MRIIFLLLLCSQFAWAGDKDIFFLKSPQWRMDVTENNDLVFYKGKTKEKIFEWHPSFAFFTILDSRVMKIGDRDYAVTQWQHGAHSTTLRIFDPTKSKGLVFEITSSFDVSCVVRGESFEVTYFDEVSKEDASIVERKIEFHP